jgi:hypothetical protein
MFLGSAVVLPNNSCFKTVPQLLYPEATAVQGIFLKKMPPRTLPERARELWNRSDAARNYSLVCPSCKARKQKRPAGSPAFIV